MPIEELERKKQLFINTLLNIDCEHLENKTKEQSLNQDWFVERKKRLTDSHFGDICKMRSNTSCRKKVHNLLYKFNTASKEINYGIQMEPLARSVFETLTGVSVKFCGLFTDSQFSYLAASPGNILHIIIKQFFLSNCVNEPILIYRRSN